MDEIKAPDDENAQLTTRSPIGSAATIAIFRERVRKCNFDNFLNASLRNLGRPERIGDHLGGVVRIAGVVQFFCELLACRETAVEIEQLYQVLD